ncbi:type II toxin-antitoxin system prevent-host-death family antitoxin [Thermus scotoductus]|uniref:Antitoxin n=1 Tax=Thermus scotoductus TaxID=37636 RepID=A0A430UWC5_THESC|nr:type II toxin-antitoxin system prevent-host-death family antitoxin [Thermus scotoductus]RTG98767.1 type II toxin-antitoxin system prevent-host-death family antitoxin [Thermus scotoductus]RTH33359.1 type II toxin-antitoxin system prevent-host-death family antitoxin [Thermus scotoductus]RTH96356.1 type II toxin-antitoxin system prevent-host-death family antitoxin [Thermus scotoductus]RTI13603.1 type II toxin-antitoxin system prevent-host-death family antitoxin [Thermus scotoductus]
MREVSAQEAQEKLPELLRWVQAGEEVLIVDQGKPVARLAPASLAEETRLAHLEHLGLLRRGKGKASLGNLPLPTSRASVLEALLEEREEG